MKRGLAFLLALPLLAECTSSKPKLLSIGTYVSTTGIGTEIISIQSSTRRAALLNSVKGRVELLSLKNPEVPTLIFTLSLGLLAGEELTSVSFHPTQDYFAAAIKAADPTAPGRVELRSASTGAPIQSVFVGIGPDGVAIDPTGQRAVVADEAEAFVYSPSTKSFESPPGTISIIDLRQGPSQAHATTLPLADQTGVYGFVEAKHERFLERDVDWNGNGVIDQTADFDGNDTIEDKSVVVGTFHGVEIKANEKKHAETFFFPLTKVSPDVMEPEAIICTRDGQQAYVTLQEVNGVVAIDLTKGLISRYYGLGTTKHPADVKKDGILSFTQTLYALREADGIALMTHGGYFVTADEGSTDPKAGKVAVGKPAGGSRSISVFDTVTGLCVGTTGSQLDEAAAKAGLYADEHSERKGSQPEMVAIEKIQGIHYAIVTLERANGIAFVSLATPSKPRVLAVAGGGKAPEGLAILRDPGSGDYFIYTANEGDGTISIFRVTR